MTELSQVCWTQRADSRMPCVSQHGGVASGARRCLCPRDRATSPLTAPCDCQWEPLRTLQMGTRKSSPVRVRSSKAKVLAGTRVFLCSADTRACSRALCGLGPASPPRRSALAWTAHLGHMVCVPSSHKAPASITQALAFG